MASGSGSVYSSTTFHRFCNSSITPPGFCVFCTDCLFDYSITSPLFASSPPIAASISPIRPHPRIRNPQRPYCLLYLLEKTLYGLQFPSIKNETKPKRSNLSNAMEEFRRFEDDGGGIKCHRYKHHFKAPGDRKSRQFQVRKKDFEVSLEGSR
ncbi:hypothetical protein L1887_30911 [Cichorium endivia]|nr:hypothetical protein L1887_30911 [Cichorium endivia]